jgi:myo-inositol-1(or 4)-monophosphatase
MEPMTNIALRAARKAGDLIARATEDMDKLEVESKGANDFVTEVDRNAESEIIYHLSKAYPDHAFLGEESGLSGNADSEYRWIIDPLDGTTNFIRGIPHFSVSIACEYRGKIEHAVVLDPIRREEFTASRGRGAQLNGRRIRVSNLDSLEHAVLGTGIPFRATQTEFMGPYMETLETLARESAAIRRAGSAALDLAYVAAGRFEAFWEIGLAPWDVAAGALLVREAGGLVADMSGGENWLESGNIVCGNPKCFKAVLQVAQPKLGQAPNLNA